MTRAEPTPLLARLENPESIDELVSGLRSLKHELIGHSQRKEAWISWGIIPILSKTLALSRSGGKRPEEGDGDKPHRTHEEEAVLQAVIILGSLALGKKRDFGSVSKNGTHPYRWRAFRVADSRQRCAIFYALHPCFFQLPAMAESSNPQDARRNCRPIPSPESELAAG